jgi:hypothetical protein
MAEEDAITGTVRFIDRRQPPVLAGGYQIHITQVLNTVGAVDDAKVPRDEKHGTLRSFTVRGERFSLDPNEVLALFPPSANRGEYVNVLPHVVFSRPTLPWERSPSLHAKGASWLAILLFEPDEAPKLQMAQVGDLARGDFSASAKDAKDGKTRKSTLGPITASYADAYALLPKGGDGKPPAFVLDQGEHWYDPCQVIDVPVGLWAKLVASPGELSWLASVRALQNAKKADRTETGEQENSIVVGNRHPQPNSACTAHLVSLEGLAAILPEDDTYAMPTITLPGGAATHVRVVSLASWSFTSVDPKETFSGYLDNVKVDALRRPDKVQGTSDADKAVADAFIRGYTAMNHRTRLGDRTVSWFRGPLLPFAETLPLVAPPSETGDGVIGTADQAVRFDPDSGMADISYAAAWQLGRLLALQSKSFAGPLYQWKRAMSRKTAAAVVHAQLNVTFATMLGGAAPEMGATVATDRRSRPALPPPTLLHRVAQLLREDLAPTLRRGATRDPNKREQKT